MDDDWSSLMGLDGDQMLSGPSTTIGQDFGHFATANGTLLCESIFDDVVCGQLIGGRHHTSSSDTGSSSNGGGPPLFDVDEDEHLTSVHEGSPIGGVAMKVESFSPSDKDDYRFTSMPVVSIKTEPIDDDRRCQRPPPISIRSTPANTLVPIRPRTLLTADPLQRVKSQPASPITYRGVARPAQYQINGGSVTNTPVTTAATNGVNKARLVLTSTLPSVSNFSLKRLCPDQSPQYDGSISSSRVTPSPPSSESSSPGVLDHGLGASAASGYGTSGYGTPNGLMFTHRGRSKMHELALKHRLITEQREAGCGSGSAGYLQLSAEEKRTLIQEGYTVPQRLPLSKPEEEALKIVRRKIKNKLSAQESRRKRKEYMETLEQRVQSYHSENAQLRQRIRQLEQSNRGLMGQLKKLQQGLTPTTNSADAPLSPPSITSTPLGGGSQTGTVLTAFMLLFMICIPAVPTILSLPFGTTQSLSINSYNSQQTAYPQMDAVNSDASTWQSRVLSTEPKPQPRCDNGLTAVPPGSTCRGASSTVVERSTTVVSLENNTNKDHDVPSSTTNIRSAVVAA